MCQRWDMTRSLHYSKLMASRERKRSDSHTPHELNTRLENGLTHGAKYWQEGKNTTMYIIASLQTCSQFFSIITEFFKYKKENSKIHLSQISEI